MGREVFFPPNWTVWGGSFVCCWVVPTEKGYKVLYTPTECRGRLVDFWYYHRKDKGYEKSVSGWSSTPPSIEGTYILVGTSLDEEEIEKRMAPLYTLEDKYGISRTTFEVLPTNKQSFGNAIVFSGDKDWQTNMWKFQLYSFLLKCVLNKSWREDVSKIVDAGYGDSSYFKAFKNNEGALMKKIKVVYEERLYPEEGDLYTRVHCNSGFYEICKGRNETMHKLLIGDSKNV